jgi:hypothetical protein
VNRELRLTRVPIAELCRPRMRSPSQWPGDRPVFDRRWPFTDHNGIAHKGLSTPAGPLARNTQSSTRAQASRQLPTQCTATLDIQGLVNRRVADAHAGVFRVIDPKSVGDLLGAPRGRPAPALSKHGATLLPYHLGACEAGAIDVRHLSREMLLDIGAQSRAAGQLARARSPCRAVGMSLCSDGAIVELATARGSVAAHLP